MAKIGGSRMKETIQRSAGEPQASADVRDSNTGQSNDHMLQGNRGQETQPEKMPDDHHQDVEHER